MAARKGIASSKGSIAVSLGVEDKVVRVRLPRSVAFDLRKFQRAQTSILDRLGCTACCSGFDIRWDFVRDFAIDEDLGVTELVAGVLKNG
jgi:hypothetical protein